MSRKLQAVLHGMKARSRGGPPPPRRTWWARPLHSAAGQPHGEPICDGRAPSTLVASFGRPNSAAPTALTWNRAFPRRFRLSAARRRAVSVLRRMLRMIGFPISSNGRPLLARPTPASHDDDKQRRFPFHHASRGQQTTAGPVVVPSRLCSEPTARVVSLVSFAKLKTFRCFGLAIRRPRS